MTYPGGSINFWCTVNVTISCAIVLDLENLFAMDREYVNV